MLCTRCKRCKYIVGQIPGSKYCSTYGDDPLNHQYEYLTAQVAGWDQARQNLKSKIIPHMKCPFEVGTNAYDLFVKGYMQGITGVEYTYWNLNYYQYGPDHIVIKTVVFEGTFDEARSKAESECNPPIYYVGIDIK